MKKLYSSVIGIDQGTVSLFSDFEDGGEMWAGSGERQRRIAVAFSETFRSPPAVTVALELLDMHNGANHRHVIKAETITNEGFEVVFTTWGDTRIARARASWTATGEVNGEEDWDIDYGS